MQVEIDAGQQEIKLVFFFTHAIMINNGAENKNLIPVAKTGGIVSRAIFIANHVVPQVTATNRNNINIVILRIHSPSLIKYVILNAQIFGNKKLYHP